MFEPCCGCAGRLPKAKRDVIGHPEKWIITPSFAPNIAVGAVGEVGGLEIALAKVRKGASLATPSRPHGSASDSDNTSTTSESGYGVEDMAVQGAVRACQPVCFRSYTGRFLSASRPVLTATAQPSAYELTLASLRTGSSSVRGSLGGGAVENTQNAVADTSLRWAVVFAHTPYSPDWSSTVRELFFQFHIIAVRCCSTLSDFECVSVA